MPDPKSAISHVTESTIRRFVDEVSNQHHAMAGAVIAASAAQAVALGQACLQISLDYQPNAVDERQTSEWIEQLSKIKASLIDWCDQDATAIAKFVALREAGDELSGQQLLCDGPAEISRLSIESANLLQMFRPWVFERVQDDLEMSITLLAGTAQAAMLLLDSNLRIWPDELLLGQYEPIRADLEKQIRRLTPVLRIRNCV